MMPGLKIGRAQRKNLKISLRKLPRSTLKLFNRALVLIVAHTIVMAIDVPIQFNWDRHDKIIVFIK